jgi:quercetin dioxygenase-like cupin family protein
MTDLDDLHVPTEPALLTPEEQRAVWFLGALDRVLVGGADTAGRLAVLEHRAERGHGSPLHRHDSDDETFFVLEGELRVEVDGRALTAGAGTAAFLPRRVPHAFVVTSAQVRYLTVNQPAGFDDFVLEVGSPGTPGGPPADEPAPTPADLAEIARRYDIEILGPPPTP